MITPPASAVAGTSGASWRRPDRRRRRRRAACRPQPSSSSFLRSCSGRSCSRAGARRAPDRPRSPDRSRRPADRRGPSPPCRAMLAGDEAAELDEIDLSRSFRRRHRRRSGGRPPGAAGATIVMADLRLALELRRRPRLGDESRPPSRRAARATAGLGFRSSPTKTTRSPPDERFGRLEVDLEAVGHEILSMAVDGRAKAGCDVARHTVNPRPRITRAGALTVRRKYAPSAGAYRVRLPCPTSFAVPKCHGPEPNAPHDTCSNAISSRSRSPPSRRASSR